MSLLIKILRHDRNVIETCKLNAISNSELYKIEFRISEFQIAFFFNKMYQLLRFKL